ncbi:MAG: glycosyltransferase family 2 protein [Bacteroidales bacterium]
MKTLIILFWIFIFIIFYTYLGYGILLYVLVKIKRLFIKKVNLPLNKNTLPTVSLLIAAFNEEDIIEEKMINNYSLKYPSDLFNIVWVTDGCTDNTDKLINKYIGNHDGKPQVLLFHEKYRNGKTAAVNRAIPLLNSDIIVLTDANTMINQNAILEIIKEFQNPKVGCVAGEKVVVISNKDNAAGSEGIYWKYESTLKKLDWELNSAVGAAGELYAIRRKLFIKMPNDTLLDDFIMSMRIAMKGYKIAYCNKAYAKEDSSLNIKEEQKRKVRISAGGIQSIYRLKPLLNIFKYRTLSFQYISHRVLRWSITPISIFLLLLINIIIAFITKDFTNFYSIILILQILFYIMGLIGKILADKQIKNIVLYIPYYFLFMNVNVIKGFFYLYNRNSNNSVWEKAKRKYND